MKKIRLHKSTLSNEAITAMAAETLRAGGLDPHAAHQIECPIGAVMKDGAVFAGSTAPASVVDAPTTAKGIYAAPTDAPLTMTFKEAMDYAKEVNQEKYLGHDDWRLPSKSELEVLFNNRVAIGGFNGSGSKFAGWYWSATSQNPWNVWCQSLTDGSQCFCSKDNHLSVRCVRLGDPA